MKQGLMKHIFLILLIFTAVIFLSCGDKNKQSHSNISGSQDEEILFAQSIYGEKTAVLVKGDLLGNGRQCAIAGLVKLKTQNSFWIEKACLFVKDGKNWNVILKMESKISSPNGELTGQVNAKNGYIISFDEDKKPLMINVVMADEYGKGASDEAVIKWDSGKNDFVFTAAEQEIPQ
jgi:hypothetical protein